MSFNRLFVDDEELGKKDDDFRPDGRTHIDDIRHSASNSSSSFASWVAGGPRIRRRRIALIAGLLILAYVFIKNIPTDLKPVGDLIDIRDPTRTIRGDPVSQKPLNDAPPSKQPPKEVPKAPSKEAPKPADVAKETPTHRQKPEQPKTTLKSEDIPALLRGGEKTTDFYFDGPLKFFDLPASLHGITHTQGYRDENKNVIFVAANTKSASRLIPLACEMSRWDRNHVHFAFLGRASTSIDTLKELNGADSKECSIYWHDARPDESEISTDGRMEYSVTSALYHINTYMHPQVYISDALEEEPRWFGKALQGHTGRVGRSLINLPTDAVERMMWLTRLDHSSLASWETLYIDILIHVPPSGSGSLMRLLKTIQEADYFGVRHPHITIELPPTIETSTQLFLDSFVWPPLSKAGGKHTSQLTLRRRISRSHPTPMDASARMVESFYSARPHQSHVLLLSTQAELSPLYYHYAFYHTLEYGYSSYFRETPEQEALLGIALDLPGTKLDGETSLGAPKISNGKKDTPFYWQAPDTHAALYFGNKWQEFHAFLSRRLDMTTTQKEKAVSAKFPAFAEPLLELMRARCWFMLYPGLPGDNAIATIHNELSAPPEEYQPPEKKKFDGVSKPKPISENTPYLEPVDVPVSFAENVEKPLLHAQLVNVLPDDGDLPDLNTLPLLAHDANAVSLREAISAAGDFATEFSHKIGGCTGEYTGVRFVNTVDDLFCDLPNPAETTKPKKATSDKPRPVRAGLEAAVASQGTDLPNALKLDPIPTERSKGGASKEAAVAVEKELSAKELANSGLALDTSEPPTPVGGGSTIRKGPLKEDAKESFSTAATLETPSVQTRLPEHASDDLEKAMKNEFQAHLDRLGKDPDKMQANVEDGLKKDAAAGKDKTDAAKGGL